MSKHQLKISSVHRRVVIDRHKVERSGTDPTGPRQPQSPLRLPRAARTRTAAPAQATPRPTACVAWRSSGASDRRPLLCRRSEGPIFGGKNTNAIAQSGRARHQSPRAPVSDVFRHTAPVALRSLRQPNRTKTIGRERRDASQTPERERREVVMPTALQRADGVPLSDDRFYARAPRAALLAARGPVRHCISGKALDPDVCILGSDGSSGASDETPAPRPLRTGSQLSDRQGPGRDRDTAV